MEILNALLLEGSQRETYISNAWALLTNVNDSWVEAPAS
jgi:hypothetical protein